MIISLNLSDNKISDACCENISDILYNKTSIVEIYLHWNKISGKGSEIIF